MAVLFTSCSVANLHTDNKYQIYPPTYFENVELYSSVQIDKNLIIIGEVVTCIEAISDGSVSINYLKKEAAKLGADGIINFRLEIGTGYFGNSVKASGTAVKYTN